MRIGRAQNSRFGSTMHARGVSSVWESAGFASRRSPVRSRYAPPVNHGFLVSEPETRRPLDAQTAAAASSFPRVFFVWRSNLLGSSGKGQEYFLRHLLGAVHDGPLAEPLAPGERPSSVRW